MKSTIKICMVGAGRVGKNHSNAILRHVPGMEIVALVDPDEKVLQGTATEFGIEGKFNSLDKAVEALDFDAVVITTPTFTHKDLAMEAAAHKKHIFLEKPMALNLEECDAIINSVREASVLLQLGFMRHFQPEFVAAFERIARGEIGRPMMIKSLTHGPGLPPAWARDLKTSNGMLAEVNSHDWDTVRWLMGSNYDRVYVEVANFKGEARGVDTANFYDNVLASVHFESGGLGQISGICPCDYGYDARVEIVGEKGIMQIGQMEGQPIVACTKRDQGLVTPIYRTWPERFMWGYILEMEHFANCIRTDTLPAVSGDDGRWAVAGVLAGTRSFMEQRSVYLREVMGEP